MRASTGFTLVELVAVLIIIGALAVFVAPRLNTTGFSQYSFHQELLAAMRHAQKTANASGCEIEVTVNAGADTYTIEYAPSGQGDCADTRTPLIKPGGSGNLKNQEAPDDVDIDVGAAFTFDPFGVPGSRQRIGLGGGREVIVEARTGYVHD